MTTLTMRLSPVRSARAVAGGSLVGQMERGGDGDDGHRGKHADERDRRAASDAAPAPAALDLVEEGVLLALAHGLPAAERGEGVLRLGHEGSLRESRAVRTQLSPLRIFA